MPGSMSSSASRLVRAVTLALAVATTAGTPAEAASLNRCEPSEQSPALISLPRDDAPRGGPVEWYYTTGHLATPRGKRYGFEAVVFQLPDLSGGAVTIGQFAVTDLNDGTFHHQTYVAPGPFPASSGGFAVTLPQGLAMSGGNGSHRIAASLPDGYRVDLRLDATKNPVYQDGDGLIPYIDPATGRQVAAQFYYSRPRMATSGIVTSPSGADAASGESWFDHEYGTLPLPLDWEWFSIQLDDGREIMAYTIRQFHTQRAYAKFGSIQDPPRDCDVQSLGASDFAMALRGAWTSPHTGITYPDRFGLAVPSRGLDLTLTPELADQEVFKTLGVPPPYWEGAVRVSGTERGRRVSGVGYVELVEI